MGPLLYLIYTYDLPNADDVITDGTYADDTAILAADTTSYGASLKLQVSLNNTIQMAKGLEDKGEQIEVCACDFHTKPRHMSRSGTEPS